MTKHACLSIFAQAPTQSAKKSLPNVQTIQTARNAVYHLSLTNLSNNERNQITLSLLVELHEIKDDPRPGVEARRNYLREQIARFSDKLVRGAHQKLLSDRAGHPFTQQDIDCLLQEARYGLSKAIERFDPSRGTQFSSYAYSVAYGEMSHYMRDKIHIIREPAAHHDKRVALQKARESGEPIPEKLKNADIVEVPQCVPTGLPGVARDGEIGAPDYLDRAEADFAPELLDKIAFAQAMQFLTGRSKADGVCMRAVLLHIHGHSDAEIARQLAPLVQRLAPKTARSLTAKGARKLINHGLEQIRQELEREI